MRSALAESGLSISLLMVLLSVLDTVPSFLYSALVTPPDVGFAARLEYGNQTGRNGEGAVMAGSERRYTLAEVCAAERMAWASSADDDRADYYYDGIIFWRLTADVPLAAREQDPPARGWWHREGCHCALCEGSRGRP
jgi:hypothetical protein